MCTVTAFAGVTMPESSTSEPYVTTIGSAAMLTELGEGAARAAAGESASPTRMSDFLRMLG